MFQSSLVLLLRYTVYGNNNNNNNFINISLIFLSYIVFFLYIKVF